MFTMSHAYIRPQHAAEEDPGGVVTEHVETGKATGGGGAHPAGIPDPVAVTETAYDPAVVRGRVPLAPLLLFIQGPSEVPSVVDGRVVVLVKEGPDGGVTTHLNDVPAGNGEILTPKETVTVLPGLMHPAASQ